MKGLITIFLISSINSLGQNGFVKLFPSDSIDVGYLKYYTPLSGGQGIEVWKDKWDKNPAKYKMEMLSEYAIRKDTFKIFRGFRPIANSKVYIEFSVAKVISRGKVNLYEVINTDNPNHSDLHGGWAIVRDDNFLSSYIYVIEDRSSQSQKALSTNKERMMNTLSEFFPEKYLTKYAEVKGKIKYTTIPALVKLYNSK